MRQRARTKGATRLTAWILTLAMCLTLLPGIALAEDEPITLVTDASTLAVGDKIIIVAAESDLAMSTTQNNNNRAQANFTKGSTTVYTLGEDVQIITLEEGTIAGTWAFNVGTGYLYAASSSSNYLRTETTLSANSSWTVTIDGTGVATVVAQGTNTRNVMQHNASNKLFACYGSASQKAINIYRLGEAAAPTAASKPTATPASGSIVSPGDTITLSCSTEGATIAYNTISADLSEGEWTTYTNGIAVPNDAAGTYTVYAKALAPAESGLEDSAVVTFMYPVATEMTIAAARAAASGTAAIVTGTVTLVDGKNVVVQDTTGGINLYFNTAPSGISLGDEITAAGTRSTYNGLEQLTGVADYTPASTGTALPAATKTIAELLADRGSGDTLESTRVFIDDAVIGAINTSGNTTLTQGESAINIYRCPALTGISAGDTVDLYAVVSDYNGYQLRVAAAADVTLVKKAETGGDTGETTTAALAETPAHLDKVYLYYPTGALALSETASGAKLSGVAATVADNALTVTEGMVELVVSVVSVEGGSQYSFVTAEGRYLTSGATGSSLSFADAPSEYSLWTLEPAGATGSYYIKNVKALYNETNPQYLEYYSGFTTYSFNSGNTGIFTFQFYKSGTAESVPEYTPDAGGDVDTGPVTDGTYVIWAPGYGKALSSTKTGYYNVGVDVSMTDGVLSGYGSTEVWTVDVDDTDSSLITISQGGQKLGMAASNNNVDLDAVNDSWQLVSLDGGLYNVKNVGRGNYLEWYAQYSNWSTYNSSSAATDGQFQLRFTPVDPMYAVDTSVERAIAQWGGGGIYDTTTNATEILGDKYASGDQADTAAVYTAVANGQTAQPYHTSTSTTTGGTNYYMGGANIGKAEGDYAQFSVNTAGWGDMELSFRIRATNAGPGELQLCYSADGGSTWKNFTTGAYSYAYYNYATSENVSREGTVTDGLVKTSMAAANYITFTFDVPGGAENCANLLIRLVPDNTKQADGDVVAVGSVTGNIRLDSVVLKGSPIVDDAITGHVTIDPDGEEDQALGTELTMTSATEGAVISYRVDGGQWQTYDEANKPTLTTLPCDVEVKATAAGKADSVTLLYHYAAGTVENVKMTPNGGGVYIPSGGSATITLSSNTEGATIYYMTSTDGTTWPEDWAEYTAPLPLTDGFGSLSVRAYAVKAGFTDSGVTTRAFTQRDTDTYGVYFGQLHSHTNISDGSGTVEEAFAYASQTAKNIDFLAVTDHSNSFDNEGSGVLAEDGSTVSTEWKAGHDAARKYTSEDFVGLYGFEMTWSNGLGHINTFNTPGWQSRTQTAYTTYNTALQTYYDTLLTVSDSISQFNHPGTTFGDFSDFAHYTEAYDELITTIEVGNGEGAIGSSGYFPSYEYYTRALDKGWHVAPTNNQDNHKGVWGDANTGRSVVLADALTEEAIYDAMRNYRVYATEDNDLKIYYTLDGNIMGSILDKSDTGETVNLSVKLSDATDAAIGKVEVIVNGGLSAASRTVTGNDETVTFTLDNDYSYYYIKVTQTDGDIAVTAPVWVGKVEAVGISSFTTDAALAVQGKEMNLTLELYNNEKTALDIESIVFSIDGQTIHTATGVTQVGKLSTERYTFPYTHDGLGQVELVATVTGTLGGATKVYSEKLSLSFATPDMVTRVIVDGTHYNDYVTGYYGGNINNLTTIAAEGQIEVTVVTDQITAEMLEDCSLLIISAPAKKSGTANAGAYEARLFSDGFIALVKDYVEAGGSVIVCGLADYQDKGAPDGTYHTAAQLNKLLEQLGSTMRINDDEAYDTVKNGGQAYRLYPESFNTDSEWTAGIVDGQVYSQYSGSTVDPGDGTWLVKGFDTTYAIDSDEDGVGGFAVGTQDAVFLACEDTEYGGTIFAAGGVFVSDFEVKAELDNIWDLPYANRTIIENIMEAVKVELLVSDIADARAGNMDDVFRIRGYVTAGTANEYNTFFDAIYVQDDTAGITVFPFSETGLELGTPIDIVGYIDSYQGDTEIQIISYDILDGEKNVIAPTKLSNADAMDYAANGGKLIQVEGTVTEVTLTSDGAGVAQFVLKDAAGDLAKVFIDGYILSGTTGTNTLGSQVKVGADVSAVGLLYMHPEGDSEESVPVLRVRDCDEIVVTSGSTGGSTSSSSKPASVTVPISGDDNTIHVGASVQGTTATVDAVDLSRLDTVIGEEVATGVVTIDFSGLKTGEPITTVEIPADVVKQIAAAASDPANDAESLEIVLSDGTSIEFDAEALGEKASQADGLDITISIEHHENAELTGAQKDAVGSRPAYDINVLSGGKHISNMGGKITVHAPYELRPGETPRGIVVWYVDENGNRERCETSYDNVRKRVNWKTDHLSLYMIDYDETLAEACDGGEDCPSAAFADVDTGLWYHEAVDYAIEYGLMNGYGNGCFGPGDDLSRGMLAQILYNLEGRPAVSGEMPFADVAQDAWYTEAVLWAAEKGLVEGDGENFHPETPITREQLATVLYRYERDRGGDVTVGETVDLLGYTDAGTVSDWALPAMRWAVAAGVVQGYDGRLDPTATASRAEVAQMLMNYLKDVNG